MERAVFKERSPFHVDRSFVSSRVASELMASAYEQVVPMVRRSLARSEEALPVPLRSGVDDLSLPLQVGGQR